MRYKEGKAIDILQKLIKCPSENPPGDTKRIAQEIIEIFQKYDAIKTKAYTNKEPIENIVLSAKGSKDGVRVIINGHLDTFKVGSIDGWTMNRLGGEVDGKYIYGRGAVDMKGGIASALNAVMEISDKVARGKGGVSVVLAGDEETAGPNGTEYLLEEVEEAKGDVVICPDAGHPKIVYYGEKGVLWIVVSGRGTGGHGAHTHIGTSAIQNVWATCSKIESELGRMKIREPQIIYETMAKYKDIIEKAEGDGSIDVIRKITVNWGVMKGGEAPNTKARYAEIRGVIRIPIGCELNEIKTHVEQCIVGDTKIEYLREANPSWTHPNHKLVETVKEAAEYIYNESVGKSIRIGSSDTRLYRMRKIPTVVYGLSGYGMGGVDERVRKEELIKHSHVLKRAITELLK